MFYSTSQKWNITSDSRIIFLSNGNCIDAAIPKAGYPLLLYSVISQLSSSQTWIIEPTPTNATFILRSVGVPNLAMSLNGKTIYLANYNSSDTKQQWKITY